MDIQHFYDKITGTFTYLVGDTETSAAVIIDPVLVYDQDAGTTSTDHVEQVLEAARQSGYDIQLILETHAHADHLTASAYCKEQTGARIAIGTGIRKVQATFQKLFNLGDEFNADGRQFDVLFEDGEAFKVGNLEFRVMATPGHTSDSNTYLVRDAAFIGDTLFRPDYGAARCDFPGGSAALLYESVQKIHALPDGTRLHLCHDYPAEGSEPQPMVLVEDSRAHNIQLKEGNSREDFVHMRTARDATLSVPRLILPSLQVNIRAGQLPPEESNQVAYLKIPLNQDLGELVPPEE